jgi:predicted AlkP superfamily phosphohydrolase/phosphomutase
MANKIIILGLDGATWTKLDEYVKKGTMPNFQSIIKKGTKSTFNSNFPFTSGTAWTTIFTGVNPGKHGIPHYSINEKQEIPSIWKILSERGLTSIVMNDLITYPPLKIKGMMISGGFSTPSQSKKFTYPIKIRDEIYEFMDEYTPSLDHSILKKAQEGKLDEFFDNVKEFGDKILQTGLHLATKHDWDIFSTTIENPDYIHHFYWDKNEFLEKFYHWLDIQINEFYKLAKANNANLFIISDHGFGPIKKHFLINTWLEQSGFTELGKPGTIRKTLSKTSMKRDLIRKSLSKFKIRKFASKFTPQIIKGMIPIETEEEGFIQKKTQVFSEAYNEITVKIDNLEEYEKTRSKIIEKLLEIEDCGQKVVKEALKKENAFHGPYVNRAHDIQLLLNEGYCWSPSIREKFLLKPEEFEKNRTGDHRPEGILFAVGPDIKSKHHIKNKIKNYDFFPTILHLLGQNIPDYVDGEVIREIFDEKSEISKINVIVENISEKQFLKKRIEELRKKSRF